MQEFITVDVTQYLRPHGRTRNTTTTLPAACREAYEDMTRLGYRFTSEVLPEGNVAATISDNSEDVDIVITQNNADVQTGLAQMLQRGKWLQANH